MSAPWRVLGVAGSLRRGSWNRRLLEATLTCAPEGIEVQVYPDLGALPLFNEDSEAQAFHSGPVREWCEAVAHAGALLISTPEYNHSVPGVLKNALDWLSRPFAAGVLAGKPVAVVGASTGSWGTRLAQAALRQVLFATEARVLTAPALYLARADSAFDPAGVLRHEPTRVVLQQILAALAALRCSPAGRQVA